MKHKILLAGGLVRDFLFDSADSLQQYLDSLYQPYQVLDRLNRDDGSLIVRIVTAYNSSDLIELYEMPGNPVPTK